MPNHPQSPRNQMRERIAQLAARMMAEDGVQDFALAKRKAARQLGAPETQNLPNNTEIERAIREYHALYQQDEQSERVDRMRRQALAAMREFEAFDPHLTGAVLAGTATRYSTIKLLLFSDSPKEVTFYLLDRNIPFKHMVRRYRIGETQQDVPALTLTGGEYEGLSLVIFSMAELRHAPRHAEDARPVEKARPQAVEALLKTSP